MTETRDYDKTAIAIAHKESHEHGGDDEISVADLEGVLEDPQPSSWPQVSGKPATFPPTDHHADHENEGGQEVNVTGLSGLLADEQDAGRIKGVIIDNSAIADGKLLGYVAATGKVEYI